MISILKTVADLENYKKQILSESGDAKTSIGFVPTMGSLHRGHFELVDRSLRQNKITVVSIFVNPAQFNDRSDFKSYPNHLSSDIEALVRMGVNAVFVPTEHEIYPNGYTYKLTEKENSMDLCGLNRPGHFDGVLTVLIKLFNLVQPTNVYMGLKDYQQYMLVKNMAKDMFLKLDVHGVETVREESGLALSSRNLNLTVNQKELADKYAQIFASSDNLEIIRTNLEKLDLKIDYLKEKWGRKFVAVTIGNIRLIDNRSLQSNAKTKKELDVNSTDRTEPSFSTNKIGLSLESKQLLQVKGEDSQIAKNILFKMSGSIACYKSCEVISKLVQKGHMVKVVATNDASSIYRKGYYRGLNWIGSVLQFV